jgi:hypothetical protein
MDSSFFADAFARLASLSRRWDVEQQKTEALFAALLEFHSRLINLSTEEPFEALASHAELEQSVPALRAKHVHGLENIMAALQKSAGRYTAIRDDISEVHANVWQRHGAAVTTAAEKAQKGGKASRSDGGAADDEGDILASEAAAMLISEPAWGIVGAGRGRDAQPVGMPAPMVCIDWVREVDGLYTSELLLKLELLEALDLGASAEVLYGLHRLWTLQPHLTPAAIERVRMLAESLNLPADASVT